MTATTADVAKVLGLTNVRSIDALQERVHRGLPFGVVDRLSQSVSASAAQMSKLLGISERTLSRRAARKRLGANESDRAVRVARVVALASSVFEDVSAAIAWLHQPLVALGGGAPIDRLDTDIGTRHVEQLLTRLEYGGVS